MNSSRSSGSFRVQREEDGHGLQKSEGSDKRQRGRKVILILFLATIGLSILFWLQGNFSFFIQDFFGPSTWTF